MKQMKLQVIQGKSDSYFHQVTQNMMTDSHKEVQIVYRLFQIIAKLSTNSTSYLNFLRQGS